jgi:hypothetical protein
MNERGQPDAGPGPQSGSDRGRDPDDQTQSGSGTLSPTTDGGTQTWDSQPGGPGDSIDRNQQLTVFARAFGFGWLGFGLIVAWQFPLVLVALPLVLPWVAEPVATNVIGTISLGFGTASGAWLYLRWSDRTVDFIDVSVPSIRDAVYIVGGVLGLFGALIGSSRLLSWLGLSGSQHSIVQQSQQNPEILLVMIPLSLLVVGPGEELLYRNVVQKSLYKAFSRRVSIVLASVVFASVHILAYGTTAESASAVLTSLGLIFVLSLVLGWLYARRENLVVPAIVHGLFNAGQFLLLYFELLS